MCCKLGKLLLKALGIVLGAFLLTFVIYFFNLDMKFMSKFVEPILLRHYDRIPRKQYV